MRILQSSTLVCALLYSCTAAAFDYVFEYEEEKVEKAPIPKMRNFEEVARIARTNGTPILVEFSTPWCSYCEALEEQVLKPLIVSGKYKGDIIIKKVEIDGYSDIRGFDGKDYNSAQISLLYDVDLYPTLVFFDARGSEISQRIIGITVMDYVSESLDKAIEQAINTPEAL